MVGANQCITNVFGETNPLVIFIAERTIKGPTHYYTWQWNSTLVHYWYSLQLKSYAKLERVLKWWFEYLDLWISIAPSQLVSIQIQFISLIFVSLFSLSRVINSCIHTYILILQISNWTLHTHLWSLFLKFINFYIQLESLVFSFEDIN